MNNSPQIQEDWKKRYDSLQLAFQKLMVRKMELERTNEILEKKNAQLIKSAQVSGGVTGEHLQKQASEINEMGEEIGRLRAILREHNINVD